MKSSELNIKSSRALPIRRAIAALMAIFLFAHLASAAPATPGRIHVKQNTYALEGDSVIIEIEISLNDALVSSKSFVLLTPVLRTDTMSRELPAIQINGRNRHKVWKRQVALGKENKAATTVINASAEETPETYIYRSVLPYEPWMEAAEFLLREDHCNCSGPLVPLSFELLASRIDNRNPPPVPPPPYEPVLTATFVTPAAEAVKRRSESGKAHLDYPANVAVLQPDLRNNAAELQRIYQLIEQLMANPDATITGIFITSYSSPEGPYKLNLTLSKKRAYLLAEHLQKKYGFAYNLFHTEGKGEDWQTLASLVEQSAMKDKDKILYIINNVDIFKGREKKLMELSGGKSYKEMLREFFPKLRRSDYELSYTVLPFTVEQGKEVLKTRPSNLSLNELFLIANTYEPGSDAFNEVFETAARIFPQSDVANLNAAASALSRRDLQSAEKYLDKIAVRDATYWNNAGVLAGLKKEYERAAECFSNAKAGGNSQAADNISEVEKVDKVEKID